MSDAEEGEMGQINLKACSEFVVGRAENLLQNAERYSR
jgi:hypothetical protein